MMKLTPAHRLALLACLPAAAGASAGTVTLLSQERSVSARVDNANVFSPVPLVEDSVAAEGFGGFEASADVFVTDEDLPEGVTLDRGSAGASASQRSSFTQQGSDVLFVFDGVASADARAGEAAGFVFEVSFRIEEDVAFELTGVGRAVDDGPTFVFADSDGDEILNLR